MKTENAIANSLENLERYVRENSFSGYDPYDALNSERLLRINNKLLKLISTQIFVYSPINLRALFDIEPDKNPKAMGLFLSSYCRLYRNGLIKKKDFVDLTSKLVAYLLKNNSKGYSGYCWGFNFNWQDLSRFSKRWLPTIVVTSYVGNSFLDLYEITEEEKYREIANSICRFILNDLNITKTEKGICFSYTPIDKHIVHNANCLGAAFLSRLYSVTLEEELLDHSKRAFDFSLSCQKDDGSWKYGIDPLTFKERNQIDFHQGFILDSLVDFIKYVGENDKKYKQSLMKGSEFYINQQFDKFGRSKWRLPWRYPVDIHHQAQGIITLSKLYTAVKKLKYLEFAEKIAKWTIENMQDEKGYFYYQKWPFLTNKIAYMRWGQAWMMLSLATLLDALKGEKRRYKTN
jgi:rhamnogalacturonyl hydrolase YesR